MRPLQKPRRVSSGWIELRNDEKARQPEENSFHSYSWFESCDFSLSLYLSFLLLHRTKIFFFALLCAQTRNIFFRSSWRGRNGWFCFSLASSLSLSFNRFHLRLPNEISNFQSSRRRWANISKRDELFFFLFFDLRMTRFFFPLHYEYSSTHLAFFSFLFFVKYYTWTAFPSLRNVRNRMN